MPTKHCQKPSKLKLPNLHRLAKRSSLIIRNSAHFCPSVFLMSLIKATLSGKASLNDLVQNMSKALPGMTKQSLWKRFSPKSTEFLCSVLGELMEERLNPIRKTLRNASIERLIVEDSTHLMMGKGNVKNFPSYGNQHTKTSGVKINLAYDLLSGGCITSTLEPALNPDNKIGQTLLQHIKKGDLVMRDLGYFVMHCFKDIQCLGAHWVSRIPKACYVVDNHGRHLKEVLKKRKQDIIDMRVFIGTESPLECRLVAVRANVEVATERKRKRRAYAQRMKKKLCPIGLLFDEWHIIITSLSEEQAGVSELMTLYTCRWSVELQFRGFKSRYNLEPVLMKTTGEHIHKAIILAAMIAHQITLKLWNAYYTILEHHGKLLSIEKMMASVADYLGEMRTIVQIHLYKPDIRHLSYETRKKNSALVNKCFFPLN